jgi:hypothetical protein
MPRENLNDLLAFLAVAKERSSTRAAAKLGVWRSVTPFVDSRSGWACGY